MGRFNGDGLKASDLDRRPGRPHGVIEGSTIGRYEAGAVIIKEGLEPGERVVIDGGKLLSSGQLVTYEGDRS